MIVSELIIMLFVKQIWVRSDNIAVGIDDNMSYMTMSMMKIMIMAVVVELMAMMEV